MDNYERLFWEAVFAAALTGAATSTSSGYTSTIISADVEYRVLAARQIADRALDERRKRLG